MNTRRQLIYKILPFIVVSESKKHLAANIYNHVQRIFHLCHTTSETKFVDRQKRDRQQIKYPTYIKSIGVVIVTPSVFTHVREIRITVTKELLK